MLAAWLAAWLRFEKKESVFGDQKVQLSTWSALKMSFWHSGPRSIIKFLVLTSFRLHFSIFQPYFLYFLYFLYIYLRITTRQLELVDYSDCVVWISQINLLFIISFKRFSIDTIHSLFHHSSFIIHDSFIATRRNLSWVKISNESLSCR